jgi:hypothetical protein
MSGGEDARAFIPPDEDLELPDLTSTRPWHPPVSLGDHTAYPVELTTTPKMAAEMQRRGWRPPAEVIATEEELIALPDGSVLVCNDGKARSYVASILGPCLRDTNPNGSTRLGYLSHLLPAQLLWRAGE